MRPRWSFEQNEALPEWSFDEEADYIENDEDEDEEELLSADPAPSSVVPFAPLPSREPDTDSHTVHSLTQRSLEALIEEQEREDVVGRMISAESAEHSFDVRRSHSEASQMSGFELWEPAISAREYHQDTPGLYALKRTAFVSPSFDNVNPSDEELVDELAPGMLIRIAEVCTLKEQSRVRARLEGTPGWITLENLNAGTRWAEKVEEADAEDSPGIYKLVAPVAVSPLVDKLTADEEDDPMEELVRGTKVEVLEACYLPSAERVRARIKEPEGWITLRNTKLSLSFAEKV